jgi:hypothetical protein
MVPKFGKINPAREGDPGVTPVPKSIEVEVTDSNPCDTRRTALKRNKSLDMASLF